MNDIASILIIIFYFALVSLAWFLPLTKYLNSWSKAIKYTIPISISLYILFGYVFYTFGWAHLFHHFYLISVVIVNAFLLTQMGSKILPDLKSLKVIIGRWQTHVYIASLVAVVFIFSRFFDAFTVIDPGAIDTFNHMRFMRDLRVDGVLSLPAYAPGFHLLIYPINLVVGDIATYRFVGPVIGLFSGLSILLAYRGLLSTKRAKLMLVALLSFPLFAPLTLQMIGFFPTAISFMVFPTLLALLIEEVHKNKEYLLLSLILIFGLSVTVPYMFVQLIPIVAALYIFLVLLRRSFLSTILIRTRVLLVLLVLGFIIAFSHTVVQNRLNDATSSTFITASILAPEPNIVSENPTLPSSENSSTNPEKQEGKERVVRSALYVNYISPIIDTAKEIFSIKGLRLPNNLLSIGAYVWGIVSLLIIYWSVKLKHTPLIILSFFGVALTLVVQAGVLELSSYRGRAGWYLLLIAILTLAHLFDKFNIFFKRSWKVIVLLLLLFGLLYPSKFYRPFYPDLFKAANSIVDNHKEGGNIILYSNEPQLGILSSNVTVEPIDLKRISSACKDSCYLLLEKRFHFIDPVLAQRFVTSEIDYKAIEEQSKEDEEEFIKTYNSIINSSELKRFSLTYENDNLFLFKQIN